MSTVRLADADDADDVEVLGRLLHAFNTEFDTETDDADVLAARFARILRDDDAVALLAHDDGPDHGPAAEPTGFAFLTLRPAIWFDGPVASLDELYVVPERRDGGIGTALIAAAREHLRARACPELHINVDEVDVDTRRFYERHGFVNVEAGTEYRMLCYVGSTERPIGKT